MEGKGGLTWLKDKKEKKKASCGPGRRVSRVPTKAREARNQLLEGDQWQEDVEDQIRAKL